MSLVILFCSTCMVSTRPFESTELEATPNGVEISSEVFRIDINYGLIDFNVFWRYVPVSHLN